jgi:hypothetical protein
VNGLSADNPNMGYLSGQNCYEQYDFGGSFNEPPPPYTFWKPPEHYIPPGEAPPPYDDSVGVTIVPCFDVTGHTLVNHNNNNRVNITGNCIVGSPTPFQQTQLISAANRQALCAANARSSPFLTTGAMITGTTMGAMAAHPIIDTMGADGSYEHITVVRINDTQPNTGAIMTATVTVDESSARERVGGVGAESGCTNTFSDSTSTSSIASSDGSSTSGEAFNSPSNCSVISSSSQSTSTQSTVRHQDNGAISRL